MSTISELSDADLRLELISLGFKAGPVTGTTRKLYEKKLESLQKGSKIKNSKKISTKNNEKKSPNLIPSFVSLKKDKESQVADTESSDNELNLTLSSNNSSTATRFGRNSIIQKLQNQNSTNLNSNFNQSNARSIIKRTPTPPRLSNLINSNNKIQPTSNSNDNFFRQNFLDTNDLNNSLYKQGYSANSSFSNSNFEDDDDHTETSRIISPNQRFNPFRNSIGGNYYTTKNISKVSSIDKIRRISRGAWDFFSRPINSSTPCVDKPLQTCFSPSKFQRFNTKYSSQNKNSLTDTCDISGWILVIGGTFLFVLGIAYFFTAHPKTVEDGKIILQSAFSESFKLFYTYAILPLITIFFVFIVAFGGYRFHKYQKCKKIDKKNRLMLLVDRITDIIRDSNNEGISELNVRDIIMPPTKRSSEDWKLWKEAANFINLEDSRVRTEVRLVDGDECNIWVWVPLTNQKWQGTAVAENSLSNSLPNKALARCIKLRGIIFTDRQNEKSELRNELLRKLSPIVPVHMEFVTGAENIVYLMLKDLDDSKKAFCAFHSHWFNGSLISAKYVRDERYVERFPKLLRE